MPVVDDPSAARLQAAEQSVVHHQAGGHAEGTRNGDGAAADVNQLSADAGVGDMPVETPAMALVRLRAEAVKMNAAKKLLGKNLRNARRANARLKSKAKKLTDSELLQIIAMRNGMARLSCRSSTGSSTAAASSSGPPQATAARSAEVSINGVDAGETADDEVPSGSASEPAVDLERMGDRMEF